jgi:hypothetical protein
MHTHRITNLEPLFMIFGASTMCAAVELSRDLDAVPHDPTPTMLTYRGESMDGAFERVEHVDIVTDSAHLEGHVVVIATNFADCHSDLLDCQVTTQPALHHARRQLPESPGEKGGISAAKPA